MMVVKTSNSFAKGWGERYKLKYIIHTPCWIEITMNQAHGLLDRKMLFTFYYFDFHWFCKTGDPSLRHRV